jgi:hypothetical protein
MANPEYVRVWQQVKQWPTELRQSLADEIIESLDGDLPVPSGEWNGDKNARRCDLIDKDIQGTINDAEKRELQVLTLQMRAYRRHVAPIPIEGATRLHEQLLRKKRQRERARDEEA